MPPEDNFDDLNMEDVAKTLLVTPSKPVAEEKGDESKIKPAQSKAPAKETAEKTQTATVEEDDETEEIPDAVEDASEEVEDDEIDPDDIDIEVTVDGKAKKVKLGELKSRYSGNDAIEKRLQEATEARSTAATKASQFHHALDLESARLQQLDKILSELSTDKSDAEWDQLRASDPSQYLLQREHQREVLEKRALIQKEQGRIAAQRQELEKQAMIEYTEGEVKKLIERVPEMADPIKAKANMEKFVETAKHYGYSMEEVAQVTDHRVFVVLNDLMNLKQAAEKTKSNLKSTLEKAIPVKQMLKANGTGKVPMSETKKLELASLKKARLTGSPEDVAKTLLVNSKKRA